MESSSSMRSSSIASSPSSASSISCSISSTSFSSCSSRSSSSSFCCASSVHRGHGSYWLMMPFASLIIVCTGSFKCSQSRFSW